MDDIIAIVVAKTGISEAMARNVVSVIVDQLKDKLPAPIANNLDAFLNGQGGNDIMNSVVDGFGSLLSGQSKSSSSAGF